ncbi:WD40 repeat-like protein [Artomyces pyxidatus]|uniref:WD40 repeat-like protein n=1 Tax=Artomyces pyxidatus TaxID=48021 RepID=A0ACB8SI95_9AGAM|nr:WD40 repeat-like protein [Artomyces pyxidatus]
MTSELAHLPKTTVQHDFCTVLSDIYSGAVPAEDIWLSVYKQDEPSVHGKISARLHDTDRNRVVLLGSKGVQLEKDDQFKYIASCPALGVASSSIVVPSEEFADPLHSKEQLPYQISSFAVSSSSAAEPALIATGLSDGTLSIYERPACPAVETIAYYAPGPSHTLKAAASSKVHKSTITAMHFVTSATLDPLLASAGADFTIHLTPISASLSSLKPTKSLTGHTRGITALQPFALAPSALLSASTDGTVRLFDMYAGALAGTWNTTGNSPAYALVDDGGLAWAALADGSAEAFDVRTPGVPVARLETGARAALSAVDVSLGGAELVVGSSDGVVSLFDVRGGTGGPRKRWRRGEAGVSGAMFVEGGRIAVAGEDGLPYVVDVSEGVSVQEELVFWNVEAVRCLHVLGDGVWIAGDGGVVRRYEI